MNQIHSVIFQGTNTKSFYIHVCLSDLLDYFCTTRYTLFGEYEVDKTDDNFIYSTCDKVAPINCYL